jgi:L-iditol 2-dehydrogenase
MKAMMLTGIRNMEMREIPEPSLTGPGDVRIKMITVGVCGSDIHYYTLGRIGSQVVNYPFTVGHEGAGVVVETGPEVKGIKPGDTVAIEPAISCHHCDQCLSGRPHTCRNLRYLGCPGQAEGCLMEYITILEECCYKLPSGLNADHGAISEPLSIGLYSVMRSVEMKERNIAILGFGPIGMSVMLSAKALGAQSVFITDKIDERLSIARLEGAALTLNPLRQDVVKEIARAVPLGLDVVFECCGKQEAVDQAVDLLKPGGKLMIVGIPEFERWAFDVDKTRRREITVQYVRRQVGCVQPSLDLMSSGVINIGRMITHRFSFSRTREAFDLVASYGDGVMKAMIDFA